MTYRPRSAPIALMLALGPLLLAGCGALDDAATPDWSAAAVRALEADGIEQSIIDCVQNVAADELTRRSLSEVELDETVGHCRRARAVIDGAEPDDSPDTELAMTEVPWALGDDPELDRLWAACDAGHGAACDELFEASPVGSEYEEFGVSCGDRPRILNCRELDEQPPEAD